MITITMPHEDNDEPKDRHDDHDRQPWWKRLFDFLFRRKES